MMYVHDIERAKSRFEADNQMTLTGVEVSREDYAALEREGRRSLLTYPVERDVPQVLTICGVTITKRPPAVSQRMIEAGLKAIRGIYADAETLTRIYRAMEDAK